MRDVYIVAATRTISGRRNGTLKEWHPVDLGATVLTELVAQTEIDPSDVDDVIFGCVLQIGSQSANIARGAWLSAGLPESVPGVTLDRQCGSSQQAVQFAAQAIASGAQDLVVAGGVEVMSLVTVSSSWELGPELGFRSPWDGDGWKDRYGDIEIHQFRAANDIALKWGISRDDMEAFALTSHERAQAAWDHGHFDAQVLQLPGTERDECIRVGITAAQLAEQDPLRPDYLLTAGTASKIADGAAALLLASEDAVTRYGLKPLARIVASVAVGSDMPLMLTGPIPATGKVLGRAGLTLEDMDLFECNEAFASVVLAWMEETGAPADRVNVNGGAIALGHALGASGARIMTTLVHELRRRGGRYGLQTICEGGGLANATIIESV